MSGFWIAFTAIGVMVAIILSQWFFLARFRRRHKLGVERMMLLEEERKYMESVLDKSRDGAANELLRHRASLISRLLAAEISGDSTENDSVMEEIGALVENRDEFMRQNRILYERWQPLMIAHLRDSGLTDEEIEICCLYAMGLNGKAIQQYTQDGRHYQNVGLIRKKLGLGEHDKNIDGYIKSLLK
jgi:hypothetical protein